MNHFKFYIYGLQKLGKNKINALIKPRVPSSHKGDHGHALLVAGSKGKMGAGVIAAKACLRSGVGLLSISVPAEERMIIQTAVPEAMAVMRGDELDFNAISAIGAGPGLGISQVSKKILKKIIHDFRKPLVLDADALNMIAGEITLLKKLSKETILTPHPKEFDRLFGAHQNENERIEKAIKMAVKYNLVIVLKSDKTVIVNKEEAVVNTTGNAGLAKGGSGDALTGIITAFLAQGYVPITAAKIGVYIHGLAADTTLKNQSLESMLITDVIEHLGEAFKKIMK